MKTVLVVMSFIFLTPQSPQILYPPFVYQGDTLVLQAESVHRYIKAFGQRIYYADSRGLVYIGIPVDQTPALYLFDDDQEIEIRKRDFPAESWRVGRQNPSTNKKRILEKKLIENAFSSGDSSHDLVKGHLYLNPLSVMDITEEFAPIHQAVDLRVKFGKFDSEKKKVFSINRGAVVISRRFMGEGNMVILYHGLDIYSVYMHLSKLLVKEGQIVEPGQQIALSGSTGHVRGPNLDFRVKIQGVYVDPLIFIDTMNRYTI